MEKRYPRRNIPIINYCEKKKTSHNVAINKPDENSSRVSSCKNSYNNSSHSNEDSNQSAYYSDDFDGIKEFSSMFEGSKTNNKEDSFLEVESSGDTLILDYDISPINKSIKIIRDSIIKSPESDNNSARINPDSEESQQPTQEQSINSYYVSSYQDND